MRESLTLKWGSLKNWQLDEEGPAFFALKKYFNDPVSMSAALQKDTDAQKDALCELVDALDGEIWNDWDSVTMSKEEAKTYIRNYGEG